MFINYSYAEIQVIDLTVQNPNSEYLEDNNQNNLNEKNNLDNENLDIIDTQDDDINFVDQTDNSLINETKDSNEGLEEFSTIWKNSNKRNLLFLIEKLNNNIYSEVIKSRLINFFIYGTYPPIGITQEEFDKIRILTLESLGDYNAITSVMSSISTYDKNKDLYDMILMKKNLADYNLTSVCGISNDDSNFTSKAYILKIKIFCSYLNNNMEEAEFYNSLLSEIDNDEFFQALYNNLLGYEKDINNINEYNYDETSLSLYSAIMRSIDLPFTQDFVDLKSPQLLKAIAISPSTDINIRIEAAQNAYSYNSLDSESIAAIYQSVDFSIDELQNPMKTISDKYINNPYLSMALLFQSSRIQILPISRLEALNNFWEYSNNFNQTQLAYDLSKDLLKSISPTSELIDFSLEASKAHLYNNNISESKKWFKLIEVGTSTNNNNINNDYLQIVFLMNLKEGKYDMEENIFENFFENLQINQEEINNLELYLTTLEYIGFNVPQDLWEITATKVKDNRTVPSIYIIKLLKESSSKNLLPELYLNIAISMEDNNWSQIHPQHVGLIFESLNTTNDDSVLSELAVEIIKSLN